LPFPEVFVPYSGSPEDVLLVRSCTWVSTLRMRVGVVSWKWRNALSWVTDDTYSSGWN
jgi:hypothetical protein